MMMMMMMMMRMRPVSVYLTPHQLDPGVRVTGCRDPKALISFAEVEVAVARPSSLLSQRFNDAGTIVDNDGEKNGDCVIGRVRDY